MATKLEKRITRLANKLHQGKQYTVSLDVDDTVFFKFKGQQKVYRVPLDAVFDMAVKWGLGITTLQRK